MTEITYLQQDGTQTRIDVDADTSVMRAAIVAGVPGIVGECGGQAMCATCHVYVRGDGSGLPPVGEDEDEMLENTATERTDRSRLSCQLRGIDTAELTVEIPERQL